MLKRLQKHAIVNGLVRTMDTENSVADAVLIAGDRIECVGSTEEVVALTGSRDQVTDLEGKALFPGFIDTHSHLSMYSMFNEHVYCGSAEVNTIKGVLARLKKRASELPPGELVMGWGFDDSILPENRGPTRKELDAVSADHPVLLIHSSIHACFMNSKAFAAVNLDIEQAIKDGCILLDENGDAQGRLLRTASFETLKALCPKAAPDNLRRALRKGIANYNAYGITATHEAGVGLGGIDAPIYLGVLQDMEKNGELNIRVRLSFLQECFEPYIAIGARPGFGNNIVSICGPKLFSDGSIQAHTAALSKPYHDRPDHKPGLLTPPEQLEELLIRYHSAGVQIAFHANGDVGIESMIEGIEKAQKLHPRKDPRHILIHCQLASDSQLARMKAVGIMPSFFGLHIWYYGDRHYERFLGPERAAQLDPAGSAVRLGLPFSLHADSPVMPPWTLRSIHTAVHRKTNGGRLLGPDQRISAEEAVRAYTSHAAYMHFAEHERGSIEPGKLADFTLLSEDILAIDPEGIADAKVLLTMVGGRVVYTA